MCLAGLFVYKHVINFVNFYLVHALLAHGASSALTLPPYLLQCKCTEKVRASVSEAIACKTHFQLSSPFILFLYPALSSEVVFGDYSAGGLTVLFSPDRWE